MMGVIGLLPAADDLGVSVVAVGKPFFGDVTFLPIDLQTLLKLDRGKVWFVQKCHRSEIITHTKFHQDRARGTKVRWGVST